MKITAPTPIQKMTKNKPLATALKISLTTLLFLSQATTHAHAASKNAKSGFLDFNIYPYLSDVDDDSVVTINIGAKLANGFSYFSLTNFGSQKNAGELNDTTTYYTEQNLRWAVNDLPIDLTVQANFRTGEDNDRHRLGFRWRLNDTQSFKSFFNYLNLSYAINFHIIQFDDQDENIWQIEHSFRLTAPSLSNRLYLAGFADHTFNEDLPSGFPANPIVAEVQLGYRLIENFYAVTEYRLNEYRREDVNNLAVGVEYKMRW